MEKQTVRVGESNGGPDGPDIDTIREVTFTGEKLETIRQGDTRGTETTVYKTDDGDIVVQTKHWTRWMEETTRYELDRYDGVPDASEVNATVEKILSAANELELTLENVT